MLISVLPFWCADSRCQWLAAQEVCDILIYVLLFGVLTAGVNGWLCRRYVTYLFLYCYFGVLTVGGGCQWLAVQVVCDMLVPVLLCADSRWGAMVGCAGSMSHTHFHIALVC